MGRLQGKVAVVTGASKGMGRHFVAALVAEGARVAALARVSDQLDTLAAEHGDAVLAIACDVANSAEVNPAIAKAAAHFGQIDLLVNNAAVFVPVMLEEASDTQVLQHIGPNLAGVIWLIRAAIPHLRRTQGQIVSISSESVRHPFPMLGLYAATKAAVETLSTALGDELRADNIRVSVLRSGSVAGGSGADNWPEGTAEKFYRKISQTGHAHIAGEAASPESMAQALIALATLPRDVNADLIVRAAREGVPEGVRALD